MASTLAQQLAQVQLLQGQAPGYKKPKGKPSLLFDYQKAADVDGAAIYEIGCQGFSDLCRLNPQFSALREALFSRAAASVLRDSLDPAAATQLNEAVEEFCLLLTQHFLSPGAFRALEYLIRQFRVHEYNVDSLMRAALAYHSTNEFVRLVQVLTLDPSRGLWSWLSPIKSSGAALPRTQLVARCLRDSALLHFMAAAAAKQGARGRAASTAYLSFYAVTLCEVVQQMEVIDDKLLSSLLPYISSGLEQGTATAYREATLMVVAALCSRTSLRKELLRGVVNSALRNIEAGPDAMRLVLMTLAHMAHTQPSLTLIPSKALKVTQLTQCHPLLPGSARL
ncbi:hypothetical protein V8C86DRAFT_793163 [Haematococcus lacustris]